MQAECNGADPRVNEQITFREFQMFSWRAILPERFIRPSRTRRAAFTPLQGDESRPGISRRPLTADGEAG